MNLNVERLLEAPTVEERLANLGRLVASNTAGILDRPLTDEVNNHVHTSYSFSPYSPARAAWTARFSGLRAVGSVDHDSISAAEEMIEACRILRIGSTVGFEVRVSFAGTPFGERRLNNPDSIGIGYIVVHGVPRPRIPDAATFLAPLARARNVRNEIQVSAMNRVLDEFGAPLVTFAEVRAHSRAGEGGSITERHILFTVALKLVNWLGRGADLRNWVQARLAHDLPARVAAFLDDPGNPHYVYDLVGVLKASFLPMFFVEPSPEECAPVEEVVSFANGISAVPAYAYLGDIEDSPTGDKRAEGYEDAYLDELVPYLSAVGFKAITYMPPRNTPAQLSRVQHLCASHDLMEISGVDINSSRQSFTCPEVAAPQFRHLIDATWALIAHEKLASADPGLSLFAPEGPLIHLPLAERIGRYARIGRAIDPAHPEDARSHAGF